MVTKVAIYILTVDKFQINRRLAFDSLKGISVSAFNDGFVVLHMAINNAKKDKGDFIFSTAHLIEAVTTISMIANRTTGAQGLFGTIIPTVNISTTITQTRSTGKMAIQTEISFKQDVPAGDGNAVLRTNAVMGEGAMTLAIDKKTKLLTVHCQHVAPPDSYTAWLDKRLQLLRMAPYILTLPHERFVKPVGGECADANLLSSSNKGLPFNIITKRGTATAKLLPKGTGKKTSTLPPGSYLRRPISTASDGRPISMALEREREYDMGDEEF